MADVSFVVDHAGCDACAARIEIALAAIGTVRSVEVDEQADVAAVRLVGPDPISEDAVRRALGEASLGSGHEYDLRPGSWVESAL